MSNDVSNAKSNIFVPITFDPPEIIKRVNIDDLNEKFDLIFIISY